MILSCFFHLFFVESISKQCMTLEHDFSLLHWFNVWITALSLYLCCVKYWCTAWGNFNFWGHRWNLKCDLSNESNWAAILQDAIYCGNGSNFLFIDEICKKCEHPIVLAHVNYAVQFDNLKLLINYVERDDIFFSCIFLCNKLNKKFAKYMGMTVSDYLICICTHQKIWETTNLLHGNCMG